MESLRGLLITVALVISMYILPLAVAVSVDIDYQNWAVGHYSVIAEKVGGNPLKVYVSLIGLVSALGLFLVRMCTNSAVLYAMR
jgi:amino acid transporter